MMSGGSAWDKPKSYVLISAQLGFLDTLLPTSSNNPAIFHWPLFPSTGAFFFGILGN
jgi:hypothetical protein